MSKPDKRPVHVAEIKKTYKGKVHLSTYLRRTFRQDGKVKHETVANISDLPEDLPVQSFQDLLQDMATLTRNSIRFESSASVFSQLTESTPLQRRVLELLSTHA